ncbi:T-cell activation Rho GTPase-activating protein [Varanus komodoensis]|nr:T-cell activation Rho GTPase-activating protein [Varanus komodoensis]
MKVLSSCNAPKSLNGSDMEALIACQSEDEIKKCQFFIPCDSDSGLCHLIDSNKKRKKATYWPFTLRRLTTGSETLGHLEPDLKPSLFDQPLSIVCSEEDMLPGAIQDILTILFLNGPFTEGIFRKAANEKARKELKEELNSGGKVAFENESVHLLAVVLKDFLRNIPHKLLLSELYDEWMTALEKVNHHEKIEAMKEVAGKLPKPNLILLKHLLCVLRRISKSSEINKMDSSNLAICFGPTMLTPDCDQSLPLEVQKELTDKVKTLVEFLIDHCSDIFGEEIHSLFSISADDSLDRTEALSASPQHDSAYDSADLEGECDSSDLQPEDPQQANGTGNRPSHAEFSSQQPLIQSTSLSTLSRLKQSVGKLDRRFSEPDMFSSKGCQEHQMKSQKLARTGENFSQQKEAGLKCQELGMPMESQPSLSGIYRNKKPPNLSIKADVQAELSSHSLPRSSSNSSLDSASSTSDSSVFTSSPLTSPSHKNALTQPQSSSLQVSDGNDTSIPNLKRHSMSFSVLRKKGLAKSQSCHSAGFLRDSFKRDSKKERHLSCRIVHTPCVDSYKPAPLGCQPKSTFMSADEVFHLVDQKNPGKPPSYEEATKNWPACRLPSYGSSTVQNTRSTVLPPSVEHQHPRLSREAANKEPKDLPSDRVFVNSDSKDKPVDVVIGIHSRANLPLTPQVYRLRTMSGSYQKNKQEYLVRRCSQPTFDHIQCAKESYV